MQCLLVAVCSAQVGRSRRGWDGTVRPTGRHNDAPATLQSRHPPSRQSGKRKHIAVRQSFMRLIGWSRHFSHRECKPCLALPLQCKLYIQYAIDYKSIGILDSQQLLLLQLRNKLGKESTGLFQKSLYSRIYSCLYLTPI